MSAPVTSVVWYSTRQAMVRSGALCSCSVRTISPGFPAGIGDRQRVERLLGDLLEIAVDEPPIGRLGVHPVSTSSADQDQRDRPFVRVASFRNRPVPPPRGRPPRRPRHYPERTGTRSSGRTAAGPRRVVRRSPAARRRAASCAVFTEPQKLICTAPVDQGATASSTPRTAAAVRDIAARVERHRHRRAGDPDPEAGLPAADRVAGRGRAGERTAQVPDLDDRQRRRHTSARRPPAPPRTVSASSRSSRMPAVACADGTVGSLWMVPISA